MSHKTVVTNIIPVWIAYALSWVLQLTIFDWMNFISLVKDLVALIGFALAAFYSLYKIRKDWDGWDPKKFIKKKVKQEDEDA